MNTTAAVAGFFGIRRTPERARQTPEKDGTYPPERPDEGILQLAAVALRPFTDKLIVVREPIEENYRTYNWRFEWSLALGKFMTKDIHFLPLDSNLILQPLSREKSASEMEAVAQSIVTDMSKFRRKPGVNIWISNSIELDSDPTHSASSRGYEAVSKLAERISPKDDTRVVAVVERKTFTDIKTVGDLHGSHSTEPYAPNGVVLRGAHDGAPRWTEF